MWPQWKLSENPKTQENTKRIEALPDIFNSMTRPGTGSC